MKKLITVIGLVLMLFPSFAQNHKDYTLPSEPKRSRYIDFPSQDRGLWFAVQATPAINSIDSFSAQVDLIAGYRTGEWLRIGAGISPKYSSGKNAMVLPVYLDLRGNLISQESRMAVPYWSFDAGYTFGGNYAYRGLYLSPTVGVRVGMPRNNFIAGITYIMQHIGPGSFLPSHGVGLRVGYEF